VRVPRRLRDPHENRAGDLRAERRRAEGELVVRREAEPAVRPAVRPQAHAHRRHRHVRGRQDQARRLRRRQAGQGAGGHAGRAAADRRRGAEDCRCDGQGEWRECQERREEGGCGDGGEGRRVITRGLGTIQRLRLCWQMLRGYHGEFCGAENGIS